MHDRRNTEDRFLQQLLCVVGYKTANLTAIGISEPRKFPRKVETAFPGVFGENSSSTQGIPVEDWERSKQSMDEYARLTKGRHK